ncbi:estrogen sulfotransferase-like [Mizuhopecten yessoensis]|uniref:Estrogen sulfotransferase n=1 Tax=Mizuhopecten yessoensis TaxID=6573 RepID=A0A210PIQ1_MIZYE|nr:estrogen sulfotransferase-like [Mizuhopecten yessoensis]OWF36359.1 Estrogen sulfotransferase [Mizuhopecten yessoensis]
MAENTGNGLGEILEIRDKSGNTMSVFKYGEDVIPLNKGLLDFVLPQEHMLRLGDMEARDDDIMICAHTKAGTHWIWEIIMMLTRGSTVYAAGPKEHAMLEFRSAEKLDALDSPRIFNTHLRLSNLPKKLVERKCKIVFLVRNPKDTAVSLYNHMSAKGSAFAYKGSFDDFLSLFMSDIFPHNAWPGYMTGWETDFALNPDVPRHIIYYEDLKQNPVHEVRMLASYLNVTCTDSFIGEIVDKCSFDNLKNGKTDSPDTTKWKFMYRKGEVGDWKNWFTVAQNEAFDKYITKETEKSNFKFKYTL